MKKYEITEDQIQDIAKGGGKTKIKEMFPEAFETKLEVGKWYKVENNGIYLFNHQLEDKSYGFFKGDWTPKSWDTSFEVWTKKPIPATESEVFEALKKEAVKRGFDLGVKIRRGFDIGLDDKIIDDKSYSSDPNFFYCLKDHFLEMYGFVIYSKGQWAEIIKEKTISKSEAEKKLTEFINDGNEYKIV